jgi:ribosomal protein S1
MKKILIVLLVLVMMLTALTGCNKQLFDTTYSFDRAIISLPNGKIIEGKIDSWIDYEDGDQIQVKINGITYLVHSSNIALIAE